MLRTHLPVLLALALSLSACKSSGTGGAETDPGDPEEASHGAAFEAVEGERLSLTFEPGAGWHQHALQIDDVGDVQAAGRVWIDQGIGPEARAPNPDEIMHEKAFTATLGEDGLFFLVEIGVTHPRTYAFTLVGCPEGAIDAACEGHDAPVAGQVVIDGREPASVTARP